MISKNNDLKCQLFVLVALLLIIPFSRGWAMDSLLNRATNFGLNVETRNDWARSEIAVPAIQNLTLFPSELGSIESPSEIDPVALKVDIVRGFEPEQRFNSQSNAALWKAYNIENSTLTETRSGLSLFLGATFYPSYAVYNLSFANPLSVSRTDFISIALSTSSSFNSSQALIGVALILRDQQGNRCHVSIVASDQYSRDSFIMSEWFLGTRFTSELIKYPYYSLRYGSISGPWFKQLSLSEPLLVLNLATAWLDGLLVGAEIGYVGSPLWVENGVPRYNMTEVDATFHFTLVHSQPFLINMQPVNSSVVAFSYQDKGLNVSGIPSRRVGVAIEGFLKPASQKEELLENETIGSHEVFFNMSKAAEAGVAVNAGVNITVFSKSVKKCLLALNNDTLVDLTDTLLRSYTKVFLFPKDASALKVLLILQRFNAWIFSLSFRDVVNMTKGGIIEEHFSTMDGEGLIDVNATIGKSTYLAMRTTGLTPRKIMIDGVEKPLTSMLVVDEDVFAIVPLSDSGENFSLHSIQYSLSVGPLYESYTATPFEVHFNGSLFSIFTPFNIEGEQGFYIPITVQMITYRTFVLQVDYDHSFFKAEQKEIMAYSTRIHYEYFALKPLQTGQSEVSLEIIDTANKKAAFSISFSVLVSGSLLSQVFLYITFGITVLSVIVIFRGKDLFKRLLCR